MVLHFSENQSIINEIYLERVDYTMAQSQYSKEEIIKTVPQTGFFGHPKGLGGLFFIEFWERFSYYGMRAILLYFMYSSVTSGGLGFDKAMAQSIMSLYGSLIYLSGIIGGWLADRLIGARRALFYGAVLIMLGHIVLAFPTGGVIAFLLSMFFIIIGTGMLKPNISGMVGGLYPDNDSRMDSGFTIFYMSVNMGALLSPLVVGQLQTSYGYHVGFSAAAIGMFFALVGYIYYSRKSLGLVGKHIPNPLTDQEKKKLIKTTSAWIIGAIVLLIITYMTNMLTFDNFSYFVTFLGIVIPIYYFQKMYRSPKTNKIEKSRLISYIPLFLSAVMFWAIQEQGSSILGAFADTNTQRHVGSYVIPAAFFQSINPLFIVLLAPVVTFIWTKLGKKAPSTPVKFAIGLLFAGASYLLMVIPTQGMTDKTLINPMWLVASFVLCVIGELCLSPIGSSVSIKLAPKAFESQMLSMWFLASAAAQGINAQLVRLYEIWSKSTYFGFLGTLAILLGIIVILLTPGIKRRMHGIK